MKKFRMVITDIDGKPIQGAVIKLVNDKYKTNEKGLTILATDSYMSKSVFFFDIGVPATNPIVCDSNGVTMPLTIAEGTN